MKTTMKTIMLAAGLAAAFTAPALAGAHESNEVQILDSFKTVFGSLGGARASADNTQRIGCTMVLSHDGGYAPPYIVCEAVNAAGTYRSCVSNNPEFVQVAASIGSYELMWFSWNDSGECVMLQVDHTSQHLP
jgi:nucleoside-specific outer membrane channel protein Tsx